jgi:hypothetical protein
MRVRDRERQGEGFEVGQQLEELRAGGGGVGQRLRFELGREEDLAAMTERRCFVESKWYRKAVPCGSEVEDLGADR